MLQVFYSCNKFFTFNFSYYSETKTLRFQHYYNILYKFKNSTSAYRIDIGSGFGPKFGTGQMNKLQNTVPEEINFPQFNMKCSKKNVILRGNISCSFTFSAAFHVISRKLGFHFGQWIVVLLHNVSKLY